MRTYSGPFEINGKRYRLQMNTEKDISLPIEDEVLSCNLVTEDKKELGGSACYSIYRDGSFRIWRDYGWDVPLKRHVKET